MREVPVTEARAQLSDLVSQVAFGREPIVLTRHGKPLVALVPADALYDSQPSGEEGSSHESTVVLDLAANPNVSHSDIAIAAHHRTVD